MVEYYFKVSYRNGLSDIPFCGNYKGITGAKKYAVEIMKKYPQYVKTEIIRYPNQSYNYKTVGIVVRKNGGFCYSNDGMKFTPINMDGRKSKSRDTEWEI